MIPNTHRHIRLLAPLAFTALGAGLALLAAGPLNPPSGVVAPSYKTLAEIEPRIAISSTNTPGNTTAVYRISQAGTYYLTGNIIATGGKNAIEVGASGVTIDLNGFLIGSFGGAAGIVPSSTAIERVIIRDGRLVGMSPAIAFAGVASVTVEGVSAEDCSGGFALGERAVVSRSEIINCGSGVGAGAYADISHVIVHASDGGIGCGPGSRVTNCTVSGSGTGTGSRAFFADSGSSISGCVASQNLGTGFYVMTGATVTNCAAYSNGDFGFVGVEASTGIAGLSFTSCTATHNDDDGFNCDGAAITDCAAHSNGDNGFDLIGCKLTNAFASYNDDAGILLAGSNFVQGCTTYNNALSELHITGSSNRVLDCNFASGTVGVLADAGGNFIARNTCRSNTTNWDIAANNKCYVVAGVNGAAFSGNAGGSQPGSTDPNANFSY